MKPGRLRTLGALAGVAAASVAISACGSSGNSNTSASGGSAQSSAGGSNTLVGAGSTLVAPLVSEWQPTYDTKTGVAITYGAIGSGGGIEQITARTVDFGASDAPLTSSQAAACKGCLEIPWALAATVVAYNVKGVPSGLHFTGPVLAGIWMGKITKWNDPQIQALNPGAHLPDTTIVPVHRTDGSGDTFAFTNYLSKVSPAFRSSLGNSTLVNWPGGIGGKGNSGVGGVLSSTNGAIAYIAIAYVLENHFDYGLVQNAAGRYPPPGIPSISAAAAALGSVPSGGTAGISLTDPPSSAAGAYPISTFTYILVPKTASPTVAKPLRAFISWAITDGQASGPKLDFAPLPSKVVSADQADVQLIK
jgi:phosphate transport system substrate-binding protein